MLPIGQQLWMKQLESYADYPPLQAPETYNLKGILSRSRLATPMQQIRDDELHSEGIMTTTGGPERVARPTRLRIPCGQ